MTNSFMRTLLACLALLAAGTSYGQSFGTSGGLPGAGSEPEFLPVDEAYQLEITTTGDTGLRLRWQIAESYYLYQHRFDFKLADAAGPIDLQVTLPQGLKKEDEYFGEVEVYYYDADIALVAARSASVAARSASAGTDNTAILTVASQGCADAGLCYPPQKQTFNVDFTSGSVTETESPALRSASTPVQQMSPPTMEDDAPQALWYMLVLAFLGGAILNLMPCVFPILSLKVLSFANSNDHDRHLQSWIYTAGVIVSFVAVAAVLIGLQRAGSAIGWGFQLQSPGFVIALAYLFVAMGLSLSGVIEFGTNLMNTGSGLADRGGHTGSFFTGVLAVVVASPCTAPFMGTALGFAVSQPPAIGLLVFAALGAGMAAPLLLFSYSGAARALMPKPGIWMETLKQFLAFPLYATALWLFWVAGRQTGINTMTSALCGALMLALGLWLWDHRAWRKAVALGCVGIAISLGAARGLDPEAAAGSNARTGKAVWSEQAVENLRQAGQPVFVDVTADWCITCKANEAAVLFTDDITQAFEDHDVVYMVADWTNHNASIAALLKKHGRTGIPLYLMYAGDSSTEPLILPQILTNSTILDALQAVSPKKSEVAHAF